MHASRYCRFTFLASLLGITLIAAGAPRASAGPAAIQEDHNVVLTAADGVKLRAYLIQPAAKEPGQSRAAIILANPWSIPAEIYELKARHLAEAGYVVLGYCSRGFGGSEGMVNAAGPKDLDDMSAWVDWLVAHANVDPERVGIAGISYGGALAVMAATHDERIKAVVSLSGWVDIGRSLLYEDGTVPGAWGSLLLSLANALGRMEPQMEDMVRRGMDYRITQEEVAAFSAPRSPGNYLARLNERAVPIMIQHCLDDNLFWSTKTVAFYNKLTGPKKLIINLGEHSTSDFMGAFGVDNKVWDRVEAWFDLYLKDKPSQLLAGEKAITVPIKRTTNSFAFDNWPEERAVRQVAYDILPGPERSRGTLEEDAAGDRAPPQTCERTIVNGQRFNVSPGSAMLGPGFETHFSVPLIKLPLTMDPAKVISFVTPPLESDTIVFGSPELALTIVPTTPRLQLIAYLYAQDTLGLLRPISHGPITMLDVRPDVPREISLHMLFTSYAVPKGHRIMLAIGTYDPYYRSPNEEAYPVHFAFGPHAPARLQIPVWDQGML